ncbi:hypothetical protein BGW36DRAFT_425599 [Talaromyces proteolyticus]|uniref:Uncharacterized protein n=1 Tax=Talaromyces proteolyticus TaxID=1131652 RepID=A0AAD4PY58_9EURO|nr:uncharacterized protein BGW36DRAFT_425599 [Talaromyces proteolyticus]KAH8700790.1 hypothetical protein BGW36DRAFT_425599 [Talaromyces proteolyticus]
MSSSEITDPPRIPSDIILNDNATLMYIVVSFCITVVVVKLCFNAYSAYIWHEQRHAIKHNDVVFFVASVLAFCQFAIISLPALHIHFIQVQNKSSFPSVDGTIATIIANLHLTFSLILLVGSSVRRLVSIPYQTSDFMVPLSSNTNITAGLSLSNSKLSFHRSVSSLSSSSSKKSIKEGTPKPVVLGMPGLPYARNPPATSHETWPRWSIIEEDEEEEVSTLTAAAAEHENDHMKDRRKESSKHLPAPPPVLKRDSHTSHYFAHITRG